ncbi:hypothetical protein FQR65_LT19740 [Abscondita terminalis]|nr:hypothetical protein FQR65_LT19740 [Abscondita terminalis]
MLAELPEETQVLIFTGNHIPELPWNIFGELKDLSMLKTIDMSNNGIMEIKGKSYHHVTNVERLILNHNNLSISSKGDENYHHPRVFSNFVNLIELHLTNAFADNTDEALAIDLHDIFVNSNLTKLFKIHLEQNEIKRFRDEYVFCDLPNLLDVYLGNNYIPSLNFNITCINKLRFLDLESNNITFFTQKDLDNLDRMTYPRRNHSLVIDIGRTATLRRLHILCIVFPREVAELVIMSFAPSIVINSLTVQIVYKFNIYEAGWCLKRLHHIVYAFPREVAELVIMSFAPSIVRRFINIYLDKPSH